MTKQKQIIGVILSAGASERMGAPKALLKFPDGRTLLEDQIAIFNSAGIEDVVTVVGADAAEIIENGCALKTTWLVNKDWELGQFSSIQTAILYCVECEYSGAILLPVDVVGTKSATISALIDGAKNNPNASAIVPQFKGKSGHPIYIAAAMFEKILSVDPNDKNSRLDVIIKSEKNVVKIEVPDENILKNVNTAEEWKHY